jgi:2'-5' RNA ligase
VRLFFAVELPRDVQARLAGIGVADASTDYRWVAPELLHVTLAFLGEQPAERLDVLRRVADEAADASARGVLRLGSPGVFGSPRAPRVMYVGLDGDLAALATLQNHLDTGLRAAGFRLEERPFRPHITLARRRASARGGAPRGWPPDHLSHDAFSMDHVMLFESRLSPRGASYVPLFQSSLTSN